MSTDFFNVSNHFYLSTDGQIEVGAPIGPGTYLKPDGTVTVGFPVNFIPPQSPQMNTFTGPASGGSESSASEDFQTFAPQSQLINQPVHANYLYSRTYKIMVIAASALLMCKAMPFIAKKTMNKSIELGASPYTSIFVGIIVGTFTGVLTAGMSYLLLKRLG